MRCHRSPPCGIFILVTPPRSKCNHGLRQTRESRSVFKGRRDVVSAGQRPLIEHSPRVRCRDGGSGSEDKWTTAVRGAREGWRGSHAPSPASGRAVGRAELPGRVSLSKSLHFLKTPLPQQQNGNENGLLAGVWREEEKGHVGASPSPCPGAVQSTRWSPGLAGLPQRPQKWISTLHSPQGSLSPRRSCRGPNHFLPPCS